MAWQRSSDVRGPVATGKDWAAENPLSVGAPLSSVEAWIGGIRPRVNRGPSPPSSPSMLPAANRTRSVRVIRRMVPCGPGLYPRDMVDAPDERPIVPAGAGRWLRQGHAREGWTRIAAGLILVLFGATAIGVILGRPLGERHVADVLTAATTIAVGAAALITRRATIPAVAWASGAAILGALPMIPPYEARIGEVTFYLGQQLNAVAWDASAGYLFTALAFTVCALLLGWSAGSSIPSPPPRPRSSLSLTVSVGLWLATFGHLFGGLFLASILLSPYLGSYGAGAALATIGGIVTLAVACYGHQGRHQAMVAIWAVTMFVATSLAIVTPSAIWEWLRIGIRLMSVLPIGVTYPIDLISRPEEDLIPLWLVAGAWLAVCVLVIVDRVRQRRSETGTTQRALAQV